ncbi:MAG TPA: class I SAM-dependent methyltransferase [Candidatus Binatia bacterium]|nr:class I SAM-dependent methyltransferase [Candidatus Binatia bacterium]
MSEGERLDHGAIRDYYDHVYHSDVAIESTVSQHLRRLARRFQPWQGKRVLDVGCGSGTWLRAAADLGAVPTGVDISQVALNACQRALPSAHLYCSLAENLPFSAVAFDFISCLGAIEHFLNPQAALREMIRVAKPGALFLLLVPNAGFLTGRLGLYSGTEQAAVHEELRSLQGWQELFESVGLRVCRRWRDLHVLSPSWIFRGPWYGWPLRAGQTLALPLWPLSWQYQIYYLCAAKKEHPLA